TGPWVTPARPPDHPPPRPPDPRPPGSRPPVSRPPVARRRGFWSVAVFVLLMAGVAVRAYRDLSRPEAWAYWKDQYFSPSLSATLIPKIDLDGAVRGHAALAIR